ncbi:MAG: 2-oxoglutarate and iron-dependent oxygenase domain-containing protein [Acidimicrobiia bacterium]|nr:2-oxoglutarate and iron-dependent oxygenase domain-containing protein [Acidimicrobiia bacterium]
MAVQDQQSSHDSRQVEHRRLPVIDLSGFLQGMPGSRDVAAEELRVLSEDVGFGSVVGHGITQQLIDDLEGETKRFHDLPMEEKLKIQIDQHQRGYVRPKATLIKHSTYAENKKFDLNGTLVMATEFEDDDPGVLAGKQFYAKNQWPEGLPGFKEIVLDYMNTVTNLGKSILPLFTTALGLHDGFFDPYFENNYTYLRLSHYPPKPLLDEDEYGLGAHADTGFMTFLPPAKEEGLQLLDPDGTWFVPELEDGALILNLGQFLERWSNGRFRATPHRVIPPRENDRYSTACFVNTNFERVAECMPTCHDADNPPKYPAESYHEFYSWYMHQTYPHYEEFSENDDSGNTTLN